MRHENREEGMNGHDNKKRSSKEKKVMRTIQSQQQKRKETGSHEVIWTESRKIRETEMKNTMKR